MTLLCKGGAAGQAATADAGFDPDQGRQQPKIL